MIYKLVSMRCDLKLIFLYIIYFSDMELKYLTFVSDITREILTSAVSSDRFTTDSILFHSLIRYDA